MTNDAKCDGQHWGGHPAFPIEDAGPEVECPNCRGQHLFATFPGKFCAFIFVCLITLSAGAQSGLLFITNNGSITITGCSYNPVLSGLVTIPDAINSLPVTTIGVNAFSGQSFITAITIPDSVTNIQYSAFAQCGALTNVVMGNGVTSIGQLAFSFCGKMTSITLGTNVISIGASAFEYCTSLTSVTIPASVTNIWGSAFEDCTDLTGAYFLGNAPTAGSALFAYCSNTTAYYLPGTTGWVATLGGSPTEVVGPLLITMQPTNLLVLAGISADFGVSLNSAYFVYQWQFNGTNILNATKATYAIPSVTTNNAGFFSVIATNSAGSVTSSNAALNVVLSPQSRTNYATSTAIFNVAAFGPEALNYQWQKNGAKLANGGNISGATNGTLMISNITDADAAIYSAVVIDADSELATSNATLTVNDSLFIATQPLSQTAGVGSNVTFSATAYGAQPLVFQWFLNNSPVGPPTSGTNVSFYILTNVQTNESGNYRVQLFNGQGSLMSSNAVLTVIVFPPSITVQPQSQSFLQGSSASFTLSVSGTPPLQYQWLFNGTDISGETNASCIIPAVFAGNAGNYSVVVTNSAGSVTSSNAVLSVIVPPELGLQFLANYPLLNLNGMPGNNFLVQYSTNLAGTNWITLLLLTNLQTSPYEFLDPAGNDQPARFYRAVMQ